jgi:hypothetical protein
MLLILGVPASLWLGWFAFLLYVMAGAAGKSEAPIYLAAGWGVCILLLVGCIVGVIRLLGAKTKPNVLPGLLIVVGVFLVGFAGFNLVKLYQWMDVAPVLLLCLLLPAGCIEVIAWIRGAKTEP